MSCSTPIKHESIPLEKRVQELFNIRSCPLDQRLYSTSAVVRAMAGALVDEVDEVANKKRRMRTKPHNDMRRFFICLLVHFFDTWIIDPASHVAVKLGKDDYRGSDFVYAAVKNGMRGLEALGYVYRAGHFWDPVKQRGVVTRFKATGKLIALLATLDLGVIQIRERSPLIEIRPTGKERRWAAKRNDKCQVYRWPNDQRGAKEKMVKNLRVLNKALQDQFQALALPDYELRDALGRNKRPVNLRQQAMHRTFLEDPQHGGRFVGPYWQSIKRELRQYIRMAAPGQAPQETVELDFDSLHPAMLYATRKFPVKGDLYGIYDCKQKNQALRPAIKKLMLTLINSDSERDAKNSFKEEVNTELYPEWLKKNYGETAAVIIPFANIDKKLAEMYSGCPNLDQLVKDIVKHHARISEYFCSGASRWLMFEDSQISEMVMLTMLREHGIVPLPNHDSYIVPKQHESALRSTMERMFSARFASITPGITRKECSGKPYDLDGSNFYSKLLTQWRATRDISQMTNSDASRAA